VCWLANCTDAPHCRPIFKFAVSANSFDVVIIGAGAAGLLCASVAGQRGLRVLLIDHAKQIAEKIRISGGGRCNFTNREVEPQHFYSHNPHFCRSALARFTPQDFLALLKKHRVAWHEKHKGQLFCDDSAQNIIDLLLSECAQGQVTRWQPCGVAQVRHHGQAFAVDTTTQGTVHSRQLVVATGGLSIPKIGATDFGHKLGKAFGHRLIAPRPALVPLTFDAALWQDWTALAGLSLPVDIRTGNAKKNTHFAEDLLFTHRGLSGPAVLQISTLWCPGLPLSLDLAPKVNLATHLLQAKQSSRRQLDNELASILPKRLVDHWMSHSEKLQATATKPMAEQRDKDLQQLAQQLHHWQIQPNGTEGYRKAEVTSGGIDTQEISSQTMQSQRTPGLYFIGEVLDVTGWLGGYNFQWAWASAWACGQALKLS
jgi:predicted Rossmann fold flavoprotein